MVTADKTKVIISMLKENTGAHFLDSGSAYGRNWERNQSRDFDKEDACLVEIDEEYNELSIEYNVYHYLNNFLDYDDTCEELEKRFNEMADLEANKDKSWFELKQMFAEQFDSPDWNGTTNTYNYDSLVSQVIEYTAFQYEDGNYILLQIHGGCDVRGGYTKPRIFNVPDWESFSLADRDVYAGCENRHYWDSDDAGYHFRFQGDEKDNPKKIEFDKVVLKGGKAFCPICGKGLTFSVSECY